MFFCLEWYLTSLLVLFVSVVVVVVSCPPDHFYSILVCIFIFPPLIKSKLEIVSTLSAMILAPLVFYLRWTPLEVHMQNSIMFQPGIVLPIICCLYQFYWKYWSAVLWCFWYGSNDSWGFLLTVARSPPIFIYTLLPNLHTAFKTHSLEAKIKGWVLLCIFGYCGVLMKLGVFSVVVADYYSLFSMGWSWISSLTLFSLPPSIAPWFPLVSLIMGAVLYSMPLSFLFIPCLPADNATSLLLYIS